MFSLPSTCPRIDFHGLDLSLVFADVGVAMEEARKAHCPGVLAKSLRLRCACKGLPTSRHVHGRHDAASSIGGARRRIFMRFSRTMLCLCAWRRREIVDDVRHVHDELSQGVLGVVCSIRCGPGQGINHALPMFSFAVFYSRRKFCVSKVFDVAYC